MTLPQPTHLTTEEYRALMAKSAGRNKYNAKGVTDNGVRYDSKAEYEFELHLRLLHSTRRILWWTRQVPFVLPGGKRYLIDFLVVSPGPAGGQYVNLIDVKGRKTPVSDLKQSVTQALYGVRIELIAALSKGGYDWLPGAGA